jgi:hypothetical protein
MNLERFVNGLTGDMVCCRKLLYELCVFCELCENPHLLQLFTVGKEISHKVRKVRKEDRLATFQHFSVGSLASRLRSFARGWMKVKGQAADLPFYLYRHRLPVISFSLEIRGTALLPAVVLPQA